MTPAPHVAGAPALDVRPRGVLRVLHLRDTDHVCGPGKTICETVRLNLDPQVRYQVTAFEDTSRNRFLERTRELCPSFGLPPSRLLLPVTAVRLARRTRAEGVHILHAHDFKTDLVALLARRLSPLAVVTTVHGYIGISAKSRAYVAADRWLQRRMDRLIAVSDAMAREFTNAGFPGSKVRLIRNCIALDRHPFGLRSRSLRELPGLEGEGPLIGHIGRLSAEKGQRRLLRAFPEILRAVPAARLVFAGSGPDAVPLGALSRALGLEERVQFLGYRPDIREVFSNLDLLVLSSDTEGLPNVVLEAMALGVPVVATAVGGTAELVRDRVTGLTVAPGDGRALVAAVVEALTRREEAQARAREARAFVEREHSMQVLIRETHALYRELAGAVT